MSAKRPKSKKPKQARIERGRYQVICSETGLPFVTMTREDAADTALELGTYFFYETDGKGPFFESLVWVWVLEENPMDEKTFLLVRYAPDELKCTCAECECSACESTRH